MFLNESYHGYDSYNGYDEDEIAIHFNTTLEVFLKWINKTLELAF